LWLQKLWVKSHIHACIFLNNILGLFMFLLCNVVKPRESRPARRLAIFLIYLQRHIFGNPADSYAAWKSEDLSAAQDSCLNYKQNMVGWFWFLCNLAQWLFRQPKTTVPRASSHRELNLQMLNIALIFLEPMLLEPIKAIESTILSPLHQFPTTCQFPTMDV
jgi:hypothetical protein